MSHPKKNYQEKTNFIEGYIEKDIQYFVPKGYPNKNKPK